MTLLILVVGICLIVPGKGFFNTKDGGGVDPTSGNNSTNSSSGCTCVRYYLCNDTIDEELLIDVNGHFEECDHFLNKCCYNIVPRPGSPEYQTSESPSGRCGVRNKNGVGFKIEDASELAQFGEFPWMVAVLRPDKAGSTLAYQCGGSLVHPRVVMTAAHCVNKKENLTIRAGEWDTRSEDELYPTQDRNVSRTIVHESYEERTLANNVALLVLESPLDMSVGNVGMICLPEANETMEGRDCVTTGWGKDSYGADGKAIVILSRADLPVAARGSCERTLQGTRLGPEFKLHDSFICAGGEGRDSCKGDSGSPLACPSRADPDVYVQAGMVSWGIGCDKPAVHVNVPHFIDWIENKLKSEGIEL